jgi:hypothetical protein
VDERESAPLPPSNMDSITDKKASVEHDGDVREGVKDTGDAGDKISEIREVVTQCD